MGHFYFVRHGQTVWNVENKICGCTDSPLTEYGREQARETGRKILAEGIQADEILCSPLSRAKDTAQLISEMTGIPCRVEPRLIEQNFGNGNPRRGMEKTLKRRKNSSPAAMREENRHFVWHRESIIFLMISRKNRKKKLTFWLPITGSPELCSLILPI